jgi:hypothetical protein
MKISPRFFPWIILVAFVLFVLLGLLLGFRPEHDGGGRHQRSGAWNYPQMVRLEATL